MKSWTVPVALLLLAMFACAAAQGEVAASGGSKHRNPPPATQCRFGWVPVSFDTEPWKNLDPQRRPKLLNYRCKEACEALGLDPVLTQDAEKPKPLCFFNATRQLGASYAIYGTWYEGEPAEGYESTCRGRDEKGGKYNEWATRWDPLFGDWTFGFQCGCSGCIQGCWNNPIPPPSDRLDVSLPGGSSSVNSGAFNCSGSLQPWGRDEKVMRPEEHPDPTAPGNPRDTCPALTNQEGTKATPPAPLNTIWTYPYDICEGKTAAFGWQWGTRLPDGTCSTSDALVADTPNAFCTANASDLPGVKSGTPWIYPKYPAAMSVEAQSSGRLDLLLGLETPAIPAAMAERAARRRGEHRT